MLRRLRSHPLSTASCSTNCILSKLHGNLLAVCVEQCMLDTGEGKDRQREERWLTQEPPWPPAVTDRCCKHSCDDGWVEMCS